MAVEIKKINGVYMGSQEIASTRFVSEVAGYWKLENVNDSSTNGYNLTNNGTVTFVAGKFSNAGSFNGTDQFLDIASFANINITTSQSWSTWIKLSSAAANGSYIAGGISDATPTGNYALISVGNGTALKPKFQLRELTGGTLSSGAIWGATTLSSDTWYHLVGVYDSVGATMKIYVNGVLDGSSACTGSHGTASGRFSIGRLGQYGAEYFKGLVDDFAIFNRALTDTEISNLYKTGVKKLNGVVNLNPELESTSLRGDANLDAYYKFESGAITTDSSANGKTLTSAGTITTGTGKFGGSASATWSNTNYLRDTAGALSPGTGAFSLGCWLKKASPATTDYTPTIIDIDNGAGLRGCLYTAKTTGYAVFQTYDGASTDTGSSVNVSDGNWHLIVGTRTGTTHCIYVDGILAGTTTGTARNLAGGILNLGRENDSTYDFLGAAEIDDTFVFSRALTSTEISNLYNTNIKKYMGVSNI